LELIESEPDNIEMKNVGPPGFASKLFNWYCGIAKVEDLEGDIDELFYLNVKRKGTFLARVIYVKQVAALIFSYAVRKRKRDAAVPALSFNSNLPMLKNYFKVSIRNLAQQRYFTVINIGGLAIGMSICLLFITLFISVTDYDEFHTNKNEIYRIITTDGQDNARASAPEALALQLKAEYPGINEIIRIGRYLFTSEPQEKQEVYIQGYFVDPAFLKVFTFPLLHGDMRALEQPRTIFLTERAAHKVFGDEDPMGKVIKMGAHGDFEIKGIIKNYPSNSHLSFEALASYSTLDAIKTDVPVAKQWSEFNNHYVYMHIGKEANVAKLQAYIDNVANEVYKNTDYKASFQIQALPDITPGPELDNQIGPQWSYLSFGIAAGLGLLILLPACFNYTNISIARSLKRSKEIGIRKTMGGVRGQIFFQFITETVIVTLLSLAGGCLIFFVIRGEFQSMMVHAAALDLSLTAERVLWFIVFALVTGLIAGVFPAWYFSKLNPIEAMKNSSGIRLLSGEKVRKGLTVFQFALCLTFILSLIVFNKQYRYAMNFDLGFHKDNIVDVSLQQVNPDVFANEFTRLPAVQSLSMSSGIMGHGVPGSWGRLESKADSSMLHYMFVDGNFISNLGLKLKGGRTFFPDESANRTIIVNETFLKRFNFNGPSEAIGERIELEQSSYEIVGVIADFHFWQLHAPVAPFCFRYDKDKFRYANIKIASSDIQQTFIDMEKKWNTIADGRVFTAEFLEKETAGAFSNYQTLLKIFGFLGLLAISISCLGLLGMVVYTAERKTKEVGIRKVMGASTWNVTYLLAKGYLKLMLIASVFSIPVALLLDKMLTGFAHYRIEITVFDVLLGMLLMLLLGVGTMVSQTLKTANANPAQTLRSE
jgi:ABC-type antimicrobial peptide transport system permease subunit